MYKFEQVALFALFLSPSPMSYALGFVVKFVNDKIKINKWIKNCSVLSQLCTGKNFGLNFPIIKKALSSFAAFGGRSVRHRYCHETDPQICSRPVLRPTSSRRPCRSCCGQSIQLDRSKLCFAPPRIQAEYWIPVTDFLQLCDPSKLCPMMCNPLSKTRYLALSKPMLFVFVHEGKKHGPWLIRSVTPLSNN